MVFHRNTFQFEMLFRIELVNELNRFCQDGKRGKAQEVELHEADIFHVLLIELADRIFWAPVGVVERTEVRELPRCNQHAAGMHAKVSREAFKGLRDSNDFLIFVVVFDRILEFRHFSNRFIKRDVPAGLHRNQLRERVRFHVRNVQCATDVSHHRLGAQGSERCDLAHRICAVRALHILNRAVAVVLAEVHVKVRHGHEVRIEEAFKKEVKMKRIQIRNAKGIRNKRACA